jgi:hypothetical protein
MKRNCLSMSFAIVSVLLLVPQPAVAQSEGIKVRGHWAITIRSAEGALVDHREFENALLPTVPPFGGFSAPLPGGNHTLVRLLARELPPMKWALLLGSGNMSDLAPCNGLSFPAFESGIFGGANGQASQQICEIMQDAPNPFATLTQRVVDSQVVLTATLRATRAGKLNQVVSLLIGSGDFAPLTGTVLPGTRMDITEGQLLEVVVKISFH